MEKLALAVRHYERLVDRADRTHFGVPKKVLVWLETDVCPALQELSGRPSFQEHARWALEALVAGAETPVRAALERLGAALETSARELLSDQPRSNVSSGSGDGCSTAQVPSSREVDDLEVIISQVRVIADGAHDDLVNPDDYFEPVPELVELADGTRLQRGETIVSLNPELLPIGNFIVRRLLQRIGLRRDSIQTLMRGTAYNQLTARQQAAHARRWKKFCDAQDEFRSLLEDSEESPVRDATVVAVQVLHAFARGFDVSWLGVSDASAERGKHSLRQRLTGSRAWDLTDRIATALTTLHTYYAGLPPPDVERERAIAAGGLVIDLRTEEAFWQQKPLRIDLTTMPGKLLATLAQKGRLKKSATVPDVYGETDVTDSAMGSLVCRLKKQLPESLRTKIKPSGTAAYKLDLHPKDIVVLPKKRGNA